MENQQKNISRIPAVDDIAIVGLGCHFPGIHGDLETPEALFDFLQLDKTAIRKPPINRWSPHELQRLSLETTPMGGFLDDISLFDAKFFHISKEQADELDPQARLFLETSVKALNHANIPLHQLNRQPVGIYCGISTGEYGQLNYKDNIHFGPYTSIGSANSSAPGRLSHFLNTQGPSLTVDTACSSSLTAVYLAQQGLLNDECHTAIVGGVHLNICLEVLEGFAKANMLSPTNQCRSFDKDRDGYVRSEGAGVVILKKYSKALKDGNRILGVIKACHMNQDGGETSFKAPNENSQIKLHQTLYHKANVQPSDIDVIETHGTGTPIGDRVEFNAIRTIHENQHSKAQPLILGAVKSNLGHTISASGVLGIIKSVLSFENELIPHNRQYHQPSEDIDLNAIPALIPIEHTPYPKQPDKKRRIQISNFGFTGTNVSILLEEAPNHSLSKRSDAEAETSFPLLLSAKSEKSLALLVKDYIHFLETTSESLVDISYSTITCRTHYGHRLFVEGKTKNELIDKLKNRQVHTDYLIEKKSVLKPGSFKELKDAFFSGYQIDPKYIIKNANPISLPLYHFDRQSYWHQPQQKRQEPCSTTILEKHHSYQVSWVTLPIEPSNAKVNILDSNDILHGENHTALATDVDAIVFDVTSEVGSRQINPPNLDSLQRLQKIVSYLVTHDIKIPLFVITANAIAVSDDNNINLNQSLLVGLVKTIALEYPALKIRLIDIDNVNQYNLKSMLACELALPSTEYEHLIAYRDQQRWVYRVNQQALAAKSFSVNSNASYLITGGLGGLGQVALKTLLELGAQSIILTSRHPHKDALAALSSLSSLYPNAHIEFIASDLSKYDSTEKLFEEIQLKHPPLKGIIHAAGVSLKKPLIDCDNNDLEHVMAGKMLGAYHLHQMSKSLLLDFFILYSSVSSTFGANNEAYYGAANEYLNQLAHYRKSHGLPAQAIQWAAWGESGMATIRSQNTAIKPGLISDADGQALLNLVLNSQCTEICFTSPSFLSFMIDFMPKPLPNAFVHLIQEKHAEKAGSQPLLTKNSESFLASLENLDNDKKLDVITKKLNHIIRELLSLEEAELINPEIGLFEIGFDSLLITELATSLKELFVDKIAIPFNIGFDYPTVEKLAIFLLEKTQQIQPELKTAKTVDDNSINQDIAVIGIDVNLPGAGNFAAFKSLLETKQDGFTPIPKSRWDVSEHYHATVGTPNKHYVKELALIEGVDQFDALFFNISPRQAKYMDPLQRLFLQSTYHALEDANIPPSKLKGSQTGVYFASSSEEYAKAYYKHYYLGQVEHSPYVSTGLAKNMLSGVVGYTFDFTGPCETIDTACSSSLVATHHAIRALRQKEIDTAIVGAGNIFLTPESTINMCALKALSPDSRCFAFDERANGYARGEGIGVIILKRLSDALRDNNKIRAVIKGSGVTSDGKSAGLTVPNGASQKKAMKLALKDSGLEPDDIQYIEAHGTGTPLGDPIEVSAIQDIYAQKTGNTAPLIIGSVKSNIGNLEAASGMAGFFKVIANLDDKKLYAQANFHNLNPKIHLESTQIATKNNSWEIAHNKKRRAGINSFGYSGTNAHVIVEEAPALNVLKNQVSNNENQALLISAKSEKSLHDLIQSYIHFLGNSSANFEDICLSSQSGRDHYAYRAALVAKTKLEAIEILKHNSFDSTHITTQTLNAPEINNASDLVSAYLHGEKISYDKLQNSKSFSAISLPSYPFEKKRYWFDIKKSDINISKPVVPVNKDAITVNKTLSDENIKAIVIKQVIQVLPTSEINASLITEKTLLSDLALDSIGLSELESNLIKLFAVTTLKLVDSSIQTIGDIILHCSSSNKITMSKKTEEPGTRNTLETLVTDCVKKVFHYKNDNPIDIKTNLFSLGLDSIMATELRSLILDKIDMPAISLQIDYFITKPSIESITAHVTSAINNQQKIKLSNRISENEYQLNYFQLVWWINNYQRFQSNINSRLYFKGKLNISALEKALNQLITANPLLRVEVNYRYPSQMIKPPKFLPLPVINLSQHRSALNEALNNDWHLFLGDRDTRVFSFKLYQLSDNEFVLNSVFSHIIGDAQMIYAYESQLRAFYEAAISGHAANVSISESAFFEYGAFINHRFEKNIEDKVLFWKKYLSKDTRLKLDTQYRVADKLFNYDVFSHFLLSDKAVSEAQKYFKRNHLNPTFGLIAAILQAIYNITGQEEILTTLMLSDREHPKYQNQIGLFLRMIILSVPIKPSTLETAKSIEQEHLYTTPYQECANILKTVQTLSPIQWLCYPLVKLFSLNPLKYSWVHPLVLKYFHKQATRSLLDNLKNWLYLKTGWTAILTSTKPQKKPLSVIFNISQTFLAGEKNSQFGNVEQIDSGLLKNVQASFQPSYISIYLSRDFHGKPYLSIKGPITDEFKEKISSDAIRFLDSLCIDFESMELKKTPA